MKRIKDTFLDTIQTVVTFEGKNILEIGCGDGARSAQIAGACKQLTALEPDPILLERAKSTHVAPNISYVAGVASELRFLNHAFDVVFFTLSLHHIPEQEMSKSIDEAVRVIKPNGHIIFLEPAFEGTFFESEILFDACDGDERRQKAVAYATMLGHERIKEVIELRDETIFLFDSVEDFIVAMNPKRGTRDEIDYFLKMNQFTLDAQRRINIFHPQYQN